MLNLIFSNRYTGIQNVDMKTSVMGWKYIDELQMIARRNFDTNFEPGSSTTSGKAMTCTVSNTLCVFIW